MKKSQFMLLAVAVLGGVTVAYLYNKIWPLGRMKGIPANMDNPNKNSTDGAKVIRMSFVDEQTQGGDGGSWPTPPPPPPTGS